MSGTDIKIETMSAKRLYETWRRSVEREGFTEPSFEELDFIEKQAWEEVCNEVVGSKKDG